MQVFFQAKGFYLVGRVYELRHALASLGRKHQTVRELVRTRGN